jgi:acetolactate decarboxylase
VEGTFDALTLRSVPGQEPPYPPLADVIAQQAVFEHTDVSGTLVGIWMPGIVGELGVPGMHLHFLSDDLTIGGHVLDCALAEGTATLDETNGFEVSLSGD